MNLSGLKAQAIKTQQDGRVEEAIALHKAILAKAPQDVDTLYRLGTAYLQTGQLAPCVRLLRKVLELAPDNVLACNNLGVALRRQGQHAQAIAALNQALQHQPRYASAHNNKGLVLFDLKRYRDALRSFEEALAVKPHYPEAENNKAMVQTRLRQYDTLPARLTGAPELELADVTLVVVDCVAYERARLAFDHCRHSCRFGAAKYLSHFTPRDDLDVQIEKLASIQAYSNFMLDELTLHFNTSHVLIAQWDGFVWHPSMWDPRFLAYDYIGAPWLSQQLYPGVPKHFNVGNGGFSLRSKRLQDFLRHNDQLVRHPKAEDVTIAQLNRAYLEASGFRFAPVEIAEQFALENGPLRPAFGVHARVELHAHSS
ncbi:MAG: hypothetical protein RIQ97_1826 [Pseudomonadota bacterium]|jgi:tetratricopeptide (TPR) repeat protein